MDVEIERKFLVEGRAFEGQARERIPMIQGYLSSVPERSVRVRIAGDRAFLTIKGTSNESGTSRFEWERAIDVADARQLLAIAEPGVIDKTRYLVPAGNHVFEVDVFHGDNAGLVMAEVELEDENEPFERPEWLGEEVTGNPDYYNARLSKKPFTTW